MSQDSPKLERSDPAVPVAKPLAPAAPPPSARRATAESLPAAGTEGDWHVAERPGPRHTWRHLLTFRGTAGFVVSLLFHVSLLLVLSLLFGVIPTSHDLTLVVTPATGKGLSLQDLSEAPVVVTSVPAESDGTDMSPLLAPVPLKIPVPADMRSLAQSSHVVPPAPVDDRSSLLLQSLSPRGGGFEGRRADRRGELLAQGGGNTESEQAVALALAWLAAHQWQDGGWRFDLEKGPCHGQCRNSGRIGTTTGATGLALLPFLGAGYTHLDGEYRDVVFQGLYYLKNHMVVTTHGGDLQEGTMYAQGIATIALCEAYAMTQDPTLRQPAQRAIDFICFAQHSKGGWRYMPGQPGDTTVFGWQMMALKSAAMAGLDVPTPVISLAERYLDSVQMAQGAYYGYIERGKNPSPTAIGLLVRMYTGWRQDDPRLARGVKYLAELGPSKKDMYFNYYATQVLHHYGGPSWPKWNVPMRDFLVHAQATEGHERGSWFFMDDHGVVGGRVYTTAMCAMILEVYYRHMPLYGETAVEEDL